MVSKKMFSSGSLGGEGGDMGDVARSKAWQQEEWQESE